MQCRRCCFGYVIAWTAVLPAAIIIIFELAEPDFPRQACIACQQQDPAQQQQGCPGPWPGVGFSGTARKAGSHPWQPRIGPSHAPAVLTPAWLPAGKGPAQHSTFDSTTELVSCCSCSGHRCLRRCCTAVSSQAVACCCGLLQALAAVSCRSWTSCWAVGTLHAGVNKIKYQSCCAFYV